MEVTAVRSAVLRDRNFSSTESSGSKGPLWSPARMIERSQEGTRGGLEGFILLAPFRNLTIRSCSPRDRPVHCIVVSRNRGYIHFQGGGWQPTLQPFLQERKHYSNRASSGVFSARKTPGREQTPFQCVGLPCWRSPSLNDGLYHRRW